MNEGVDLKQYIEITSQFSYNRFECLGGGNFGKVYAGWDHQRQTQVAVKHIPIKTLRRLNGQEKRQIEILASLNHPNVMASYGHHYNKDGLFLFLQYCKKGQLSAYLGRHRLTEKEALALFKQLITGMIYINDKGFFHRDLKPDNLLLTQRNELKIADFGTARDSIDTKATFQRCTPIYSAPQVYLMEYYQQIEGKYSKNCDVFSAGYILYEMLTGEQLTKGLTTASELNQFLRQNKANGFKIDHPSLTPSWIGILKKMLEFNPKNRPTFKQLLPEINILLANSQAPRCDRPASLEEKNLSAAIVEKVRVLLESEERHNNYFTNCLKMLFCYQQQQSQLIPRVYKLLCLYFSLGRYCYLSDEFLALLHNPNSIVVDGKSLEAQEKFILPGDKKIILEFIDSMAIRVNKGIEQIRSLMIKQIIPQIQSILRQPVGHLERKVLQQFNLSKQISNFRQEQYASEGEYIQRFKRCVNNLFKTRAQTEILSDSDLKIYLILLIISKKSEKDIFPSFENVKPMERSHIINQITKLKHPEN